ncbi:hypothetical protein EYB58_10825 [Desulfobacter hydrogenophilus]|uniref:Uncharacterized protein n=1 Tax=Desulfobacter hydrogenophilus TaxID=2291 RepID=A0ABX5RFW4_9BACT|nr:hypothetical protein [Desulfobacter hydrogenophilus]NDY73769.1 hypothetical protein [Desulfobacter hydrogenophilus]QBH13370.1 hypothetical protein EYB58_10825 [Desulfobacter hydrogenophilus]
MTAILMPMAQLEKQIFYPYVSSDILAMQIKITTMIYCKAIIKQELFLSTYLLTFWRWKALFTLINNFPFDDLTIICEMGQAFRKLLC